MKRILISGYYGFGNAGDEATLALMLGRIRAALPEVEITVLSQTPEETARQHRVQSVYRMGVMPVLGALWRCDLLISGGGSLIQDATSSKSLEYYLALIRLARLMGKKVMLYSQGIGPLVRKKHYAHVARCLEKADAVILRDWQSRSLLAEIGMDVSRVQVTADPVLGAERPSLLPGEALLQKAGLPERQPGRLRVGWALKDDGSPDFLARQEEAIRLLQQTRGADVVLLPFYREQDLPPAQKIQQNLGGSVVLVDGQPTPEQLLSAVGNLDVMVGVRLHALIYSAVMGVPMVGISYDPKIDGFLSDLGLMPVSDTRHFTPRDFLTTFDGVVSTWDWQQKNILTRVEKARQTLDINEKWMLTLLKGGQ